MKNNIFALIDNLNNSLYKLFFLRETASLDLTEEENFAREKIIHDICLDIEKNTNTIRAHITRKNL